MPPKSVQPSIIQTTRTFKRRYSFEMRVYSDMSMGMPERTKVTCYSIGNIVKIPLINCMPAVEPYSFTADESNKNMDIFVGYDHDSNMISLSTEDVGESTVSIAINNLSFDIYLISKKVMINKESLLLTFNEKSTLKLSNYKNKIKWKSSGPDVVKVNSKGL